MKIRKIHSAKPTHYSAFTLIELVVAVTIFAVIAAAIGLSLYSGIKIWDRARNVDFVKANLLLDLEMIARELYQSIDMREIAFEGTAQGFSFPSLSGNSIVKIVYRFDPGEKTLYKTMISFKDILANKDKKDTDYPAEKALALDEFSVGYYYYDKVKKEYVLSDNWTKDKGIFSAIELRGKFKNEDFSKKIFIPISQ